MAPWRLRPPNPDKTFVAVTNPPHPIVLDGERRPRPRRGHPTFGGGANMIKGLLVLTIGVGLAVGGMSAAHDERHGSVKVLAARDIAEKLDGKEAKATAVEVTLEPGQAGDAH